MALIVMTGENTFQYYDDGRGGTTGNVDVVTQEEASSLGFEPGDMYRNDDPRNKANKQSPTPTAQAGGGSSSAGGGDGFVADSYRNEQTGEVLTAADYEAREYGKAIRETTATTAADGTLTFELPPCERDVAVKVTFHRDVRNGIARPRLTW